MIAVGAKMATAMGADLGTASPEQETSVIRRISRSGADVVVVAGSDPHGTNTGVATLMQMIRADGKVCLSRWSARFEKQTQLCSPWHSSKWVAAELSLCFSLVERSGLEEIHRYRLGAANQSVLPVALHGNSAGSTVCGRRSLSAGSSSRSGLRKEPARHGSVDHAVGQSHRDVRLRHAEIPESVPTGSAIARRT